MQLNPTRMGIHKAYSEKYLHMGILIVVNRDIPVVVRFLWYKFYTILSLPGNRAPTRPTSNCWRTTSPTTWWTGYGRPWTRPRDRGQRRRRPRCSSHWRRQGRAPREVCHPPICCLGKKKQPISESYLRTFCSKVGPLLFMCPCFY
jgi:hypothetical protein